MEELCNLINWRPWIWTSATQSNDSDTHIDSINDDSNTDNQSNDNDNNPANNNIDTNKSNYNLPDPTNSLVGLRKDLQIQYIPKNNNLWIDAKIISHAGKRSGKYQHHWNLKTEDKTIVVDFRNDITKWRKKDVDEHDIEEIQTNEVFLVETDKEVENKMIEEAKNKELHT